MLIESAWFLPSEKTFELVLQKPTHFMTLPSSKPFRSSWHLIPERRTQSMVPILPPIFAYPKHLSHTGASFSPQNSMFISMATPSLMLFPTPTFSSESTQDHHKFFCCKIFAIIPNCPTC